MNRIHLVATGGTVAASEKDGAVGLDPATRPAILDFLPSRIDCTWSRPFSILSENATSKHWADLSRHISALPLHELDALLVAHGSDTLAWTASALSYTLRGIQVPVVLFGADKPLADPTSNGPDNFRAGISFALSEKLPGVFVSWRDRPHAPDIHLGTRLVPADPHLDRFRSPLDAAFGAVVGGTFSRIPHAENPSRSDLSDRATLERWTESLRTMAEPCLFEDRVLVLSDHPGLDHAPLLSDIGKWKAVLQIAHHSGTAASFDGPGSFLHLARTARNQGVPVFLGPTKSTLPYTGREALVEAGVLIAPNQTWPSLAVKIRHLVAMGRLDRIHEDLSWELLGNRDLL